MSWLAGFLSVSDSNKQVLSLKPCIASCYRRRKAGDPPSATATAMLQCPQRSRVCAFGIGVVIHTRAHQGRKHSSWLLRQRWSPDDSRKGCNYNTFIIWYLLHTYCTLRIYLRCEGSVYRAFEMRILGQLLKLSWIIFSRNFKGVTCLKVTDHMTGSGGAVLVLVLMIESFVLLG